MEPTGQRGSSTSPVTEPASPPPSDGRAIAPRSGRGPGTATRGELATRIRESRVLPVLALLVLAAAIAAWLQHWAVQTHAWQNDEELYRHFASAIARDFPLGILNVDASYGRGIQRVHLLVFALPMTFTRAPAAFNIAHLLFVVGYVSAMVPAWLLGRGAGLGRWKALVPATLAVLVPWAVLTTSFLTESLGYGAFTWALWAVWRAVVRPSVKADALALAVLALAALTRTGFLLLAPVLPLAALAQAWRFGVPGASAGERLRNWPLAALRRQPLAIIASTIALLVLAGYWAGILPGGSGRVVGTYSSALPPLDVVVLKWRTFGSRIAAGTGFIFAAAAFPWIVTQVRRPRSPGAYALAVTASLGAVAVLAALVNGPGDERYAMYVAVPVVLVGSVALLRAEVGAAGLAAGGLAMFALFAVAIWTPLTDGSDFGYFSYPVESGVVRVVFSRVSENAFAVLLAAGFLAAAAAVRLAGPARVLPLLLVAAAAWQLGMTQYTLRNYVTKAGSASAADTSERAFVDLGVPDGEDVGVWAVPAGEVGTYSTIWREIQYWNISMRSVVAPHTPVSNVTGYFPYPFGTYDVQPDLDLASGRLRWQGEPRMPRYLVVARRPLAVELRWHTVAAASYIPAELVRVEQPARARYVVDGVQPDMAIAANGSARIRIYREDAGPRCAYVDLLAPTAVNAARGGTVTYVASLNGRPLHHLTLPQEGRARLFFPLRFARGEPRLRVDVATRGGIRSVDGRYLAAQIGAIELSNAPCRARIVS